MPLRVISYDGASYKSQLLDKDITERYPVITLVLYFGTREWNRPLSLYDSLEDVPEEIKPYLNDYKINLFQIAFLSDETVKKFKSDFGIVADFFVQKRKNNEYAPSNKQIKYIDAFLKLMKALTGEKDYVQANMEGGVKSMCDVLQREKNKGRTEGLAEGLAEGETIGTIKTLSSYMEKTPEEIATIVNRPVEFVEEILKR